MLHFILIRSICRYRVSWQRHQKKMRERQEAALEKERLAYAAIDWHDFVVVQTVDFQPNETSEFICSRQIVSLF